jgi:serine phosphatase RsbU (regulator of sigma subunit)
VFTVWIIPLRPDPTARLVYKELWMSSGSSLVIFSDGCIEVQNRAQEEFCDERLIACCRTIAPGIGAEEWPED